MNGIENKIFRKRSLTSNGESESASSSYSLNDILHDQNLIQKGFYLDTNIVQALGSNRMHMLWDCWELALTNQPFMLVGDSPAICGQAIFAILSLISPLEYIGDFRPYFTIYDNDFKRISEQLDAASLNNIVIGVTNQLFLKTLANFPVIVRLDQEFEIQKSSKKLKFLSSKRIKYVR